MIGTSLAVAGIVFVITIYRQEMKGRKLLAQQLARDEEDWIRARAWSLLNNGLEIEIITGGVLDVREEA